MIRLHGKCDIIHFYYIRWKIIYHITKLDSNSEKLNLFVDIYPSSADQKLHEVRKVPG